MLDKIQAINRWYRERETSMEIKLGALSSETAVKKSKKY
jgi:hypothetical protein